MVPELLVVWEPQALEAEWLLDLAVELDAHWCSRENLDPSFTVLRAYTRVPNPRTLCIVEIHVCAPNYTHAKRARDFLGVCDISNWTEGSTFAG